MPVSERSPCQFVICRVRPNLKKIQTGQTQRPQRENTRLMATGTQSRLGNRSDLRLGKACQLRLKKD
jgi:hypothetical protein